MPVCITNLLFYTGSNTQLKTQCASRTILSDELIFIVYKGLAARGFFLKVIILKTQEALSGYLVECGWGATRTKDSYLKRKYESLVSRRGKKKALVAVGHKIIIAAYHIIKHKEAYKEPLLKENSKRKTKKIKSYLNKLKELGIEVELKQAS